MADAPPSLRELERLLFGLIRAPDGVEPALAARGLSAAALAAVVAGDDRLSPLGRVGIYADMYFLRLLDVLRGAFPKLVTALGDDLFAAVATDYLDACPSRHPSLRHLGDRLAAFLRGPDDVRPHIEAGVLEPWAADLAALEWARYDVFDEADAPVLSLAALQALPPDRFPALPLKLIPAHRRLASDYPVEALWRALGDDQDEVAAPEAAPRHLLVWRQDGAVYHRAVDEREASLLARVPGGLPFGALCEELAARDESTAAETAFHLLARWTSDGLLCDGPAVS